MSNDFFRDTGGYLYHIELLYTSDAHSRRIFVDGKDVGLLLFHDWKFLVELTAPRIEVRVLNKLPAIINEDSSIQRQRLVDDQVIMVRKARAGLNERGIAHERLSDKEAVALYLSSSSPKPTA